MVDPSYIACNAVLTVTLITLVKSVMHLFPIYDSIGVWAYPRAILFNDSVCLSDRRIVLLHSVAGSV